MASTQEGEKQGILVEIAGKLHKVESFFKTMRNYLDAGWFLLQLSRVFMSNKG